MKQILIGFLLFLSALANAQVSPQTSSIKLYRQGDAVILSDTADNYKRIWPYTSVAPSVTVENYLNQYVRVKSPIGVQYYQPARFKNAAGAVWGATTKSAVDAWAAAIPTGGGGGGLSQATADALYKSSSYVPTWTEVTSKPTTFTPSSHTHTSTDVTNFVAGVRAAFTPGANISISNGVISATGGGATAVSQLSNDLGLLNTAQVNALVYTAVDTAHSHLDETSFLGAGTTADPFRAKPGRGFNPRGAWQPSTAYVTDDLVTLNGNTYRALSSFTSGASFSGSNWEVWAAKGQDGSGLSADYSLFSTMVLETEAIPVSTANITLTSGSVYERKVVAPKSGTVSQVAFRVITAGASLTAGVANNSIAILDASGNRLAIADCNTAYTTTGDKLITLDTPISIVSGTTYWISVISTGTTPAILAGTTGTNLINLNQSAAPYNWQRLTTGGNSTTVAITGGNIVDARGSGRVYIALF